MSDPTRRITPRRFAEIRADHQNDGAVEKWYQSHADRAHDQRGELLGYIVAEREELRERKATIAELEATIRDLEKQIDELVEAGGAISA